METGAGFEHALVNLDRALTGRLVHATKLTGGSSADVYVLDIETTFGNRRRAVFRQHSAEFKGHADSVTAKEYRVLAALHARGIAVPEPYLLYAGSEAMAPYLVMQWIEGEPSVDPAELHDAIEQMARFLLQVHSLPAESFTVAELDELEDPAEAMLAYLPSTETGDRMRVALHAGRRARVDNPLVLVHGDYWPGNVLWRAGRLAAVIDWEDAAIGDPLADLACARVELLCRYGAAAMNHFTATYLAFSREANRALLLDSLTLWEAYVAASALATMHRWGLDPDDETHRRTQTMRFFERAASEFLSQR